MAFFILLISTLNFASAYDSQLFQSCGGDAQTIFGCIGDSESSFIGIVTSQSQNLPILGIIKPKNETYFNNNSLKVQINTNADNSLFNLDNGENETIQNLKNFEVNEGVHTIYVFANNSAGITTGNVTFTINKTKITINNTIYSGSDKGETTNFSEYSYEEIQNLSNVILEKAEKGKIKFNQNINFTNDSNPEDNIVDLDNNIIITFNKIEINSSALPNFNKTATLSLYDLSFANPQILIDGFPCPDSICTKITYSGGTLEFNVSHFTIYSTQETPESATTGSTGGGSSEECYDNSDCRTPGYGICWNHECVPRLFDVKILGFESPVKLGDFFVFTYSLKDMANVDSDVNVNFWIEKDGRNITSGSDIVFVGELEEITEIGKLFIPEDTESGKYTFYVQISNNAEIAKVHRIIQISVDEEKGTATIIDIPEGPGTVVVITVFSVIIIVLAIFFYTMYLKNKERIAKLQKMMKNINKRKRK